MEDYYTFYLFEKNGKSIRLYGIFDGHCGSETASQLKENIPGLFKDLFDLDNPEESIRLILEIASDALKDINGAGSTMVLLILIDNIAYMVNVGDSRLMISKKEIIHTVDHKPEAEKERLYAVFEKDDNYPNKKAIEHFMFRRNYDGKIIVVNQYSLSRSFGHINCPYIINTPDITKVFLDDTSPGYAVLASDGLWDVLTCEQVDAYIKEYIPRIIERYAKQGCTTLNCMARILVNKAIEYGSKDNISVIIVDLGLI